MTPPRILTLLLAALLSAVLAVPWAPAAWGDGDEGKSGDNAAEAFNEKDGSSVFDLAFDVREVSNGVVDQTNSAVAYANCENCQTVAIAIQIVLVSGAASVVTPENYAIAVNEECVSCQTLALAYQFVLGGGQPLEFTKEGRRRLKRIQRAFKELGKSGLTADEIRARAHILVGQIRELLETQLVPAKDRDEDEDDDRSGDESDDRGTTTPAEPPDSQPAPENPAEPYDPGQEQPPATTEEAPPPTTTEPAPEDGATTPTTP
jgi:putative peptide zinc metalloprotease protein